MKPKIYEARHQINRECQERNPERFEISEVLRAVRRITNADHHRTRTAMGHPNLNACLYGMPIRFYLEMCPFLSCMHYRAKMHHHWVEKPLFGVI